MSDSVRSHRRQPTRLLRLWDLPGKNTGVGCHFLLQCMKVKSESEVPQSCPTPSDPMDCSPPGSSAHGIFQARALEWGAVAFSNIYIQVYIVVNPIYPNTLQYYLFLTTRDKVVIVRPGCLTYSEKIRGTFFFTSVVKDVGVCMEGACRESK